MTDNFLNRVRNLIYTQEQQKEMIEKGDSGDSEVIGRLVIRNRQFVVYGNCCIPCLTIDELEHPVNVYRLNIGDYKQLCYNCRGVLVKGKTELWPELYDTLQHTQERKEKQRNYPVRKKRQSIDVKTYLKLRKDIFDKLTFIADKQSDTARIEFLTRLSMFLDSELRDMGYALSVADIKEKEQL